MYLSQILVSGLFLVSLACSTFAANATSTPKPVTVGKVGARNTTKNTTPKTTASQNGTSTRIGQTVSVLKNGTRIGAAAGSSGAISTRFGGEGYTAGEECQCTLSYLCNPENRVPGSDCSDSAFICCRIPYASVAVPNSAPSSYVDSTSPQPTSDGECTCVVHTECLDATIIEGGGGIFQPRFKCESPDVCCPNDKISKAREPPQSPLPPINFPQPPVTKSPSEECICVNIESCLDKEFISGGGFNINPRFGTCQQPQVCCPADKVSGGGTIYPPVVVTESPVITPPTEPVPFPQPVDPNVCNPEYCGKRQGVEKRITAPEDWAKTDFGEFPWMVLILKMEFSKDGSFVDEELLCGGSLLSASVVLTAAHCVHGVDKGLMKIRAGEYDTRQGAYEQKIHQDRFVDKISIHEKFDKRVLYNDLAIIRVSENFVLDSHIFPICIPHIKSPYADSSIYDPNVCVATGWGKNAFHNGQYQNTLKKVDLSLVPRDECELKLQQTKLTSGFKLHSSFTCAKGLIGHDTCKGDGGGPLVCALRDDPFRYVQVGVVAWGLECGLDVPAVYASLEANKIWLTNELNFMNVFKRSSS